MPPFFFQGAVSDQAAQCAGGSAGASALLGAVTLVLCGLVLLALPLGLVLWGRRTLSSNDDDTSTTSKDIRDMGAAADGGLSQADELKEEERETAGSGGLPQQRAGEGSSSSSSSEGAAGAAPVGCCRGGAARQQDSDEQGQQQAGPGGAPASGCACAAEALEAEEKPGSSSSRQQQEGVLSSLVRVPLKVLWASTTGTAQRFAQVIEREAFAMNVSGFHFDVSTAHLADYDYVDKLEEETLVVFVISTFTDGKPPEASKDFFRYVEDASQDFRYGSGALKGLRFAVFGLGGAVYDEDDHFCTPAKDLTGWLADMGATAVVETGLGDDASDLEAQFEAWRDKAWPALCEQYAQLAGVTAAKEEEAAAAGGCGAGCGSGGGVKESKDVYKVALSWEEQEEEQQGGGGGRPTRKMRRKAGSSKKKEKEQTDSSSPARPTDGEGEGEDVELEEEEDRLNARLVEWSSDEDEDDGGGVPARSSSSSSSSQGKKEKASSSSSLLDLEDLGSLLATGFNNQHQNHGHSSTGAAAGAGGGAPEMVTPLQRKSLVKEGYKIIGSHSAVKLCRWTKHQLRGRGACYKRAFYGINSYQCMEMTPSLACSNKCVFCWRHHKNPVGKEWRWAVDDPVRIVEEGVTRHQRMINEFKGVPGLKQDRWEAAFTIRHCALSLVGEPIMYPHINELVSELHRRHISSFLVTNAQHPEKIAALAPVTQLYVSIDAATKDTLKAIDRPLFKDFWERFLHSLEQLRVKGQRTVYRLTLVKGWNMEEVDNYVQLIKLGEPDLVEIKGVTFCGKSDASSLRMDNVPWHHEVRKFAQAIADRSDGRYEFMAEHAHSCCTLLALKSKFLVGGKWHTWIDYDRFNQLVRKYELDGSEFSSTDYMAETPAWVLKGAPEEGFDPQDVRYRKVKGLPNQPESQLLQEYRYKPSESGCG